MKNGFSFILYPYTSVYQNIKIEAKKIIEEAFKNKCSFHFIILEVYVKDN